MDIANEVKKIDAPTATAVSVFFVCFLAPGFLTLFYFKKDLFLNLETVKLIILSVSISAPGFFIPYFITFITASVLKHKGIIGQNQLGTNVGWYRKHGINNAINMYLILFISYVFSLSFIWFAWLFLATILVSALFEIFHLNKLSKDPEKHVPMEESGC